MSKYFLVAKGEIIYYPEEHIIEWLLPRDYDFMKCCCIELDPQTKVITKYSEKYQLFFEDGPHFRGNELWANGKNYLLKLNLGERSCRR
jgi:hypothetical protein